MNNSVAAHIARIAQHAPHTAPPLLPEVRVVPQARPLLPNVRHDFVLTLTRLRRIAQNDRHLLPRLPATREPLGDVPTVGVGVWVRVRFESGTTASGEREG